MIHVRFSTPRYDATAAAWNEELVAELLADGDRITISGPHAEWVNTDVAIVDPETGRRVTRADGAERWARLLPFAYRAGDITVEVVEMANTAAPEGAFHYPAAA